MNAVTQQWSNNSLIFF